MFRRMLSMRAVYVREPASRPAPRTSVDPGPKETESCWDARTNSISGDTRNSPRVVWYRNRLMSTSSWVWDDRISSAVLWPYLDAKYMPPPMVMAATCRAAGRARTRARSDGPWPSWLSINGTPTATVTGVRYSSSGTTLARYTSLTYLLRLTAELFRIQSLSFSIHLVAFPDPKEPMMKRMKRKEVGEDWNEPERA